jgi:predicted lipoprotein with Yx(FWY)xxD motif
MARRWTLSTLALLALVIGGLANSAASATREGSASQAQSRATVKVSQSKLGRILVDARGRTLYLFTAETSGTVVCKSDFMGCTRVWPPFLTTGKPRAGAGANARLLGTIRRTKPAGLQVTYKGHPLYFYSADKKPGDTLGQKYFQVWYVVSPKGTAIKK